jgi:hypothetical protein
MKFLMIMTILTLGALSACSSTKENKNLAQRIHTQELRTFQEIKADASLVLENHPELDKSTKNELSNLLNTTIDKHVALKEEEAKIFQLLLNKSLRLAQLSENELSDKKDLKKRLKELYKEKSKNVLNLIDHIVKLSDKRLINDSLKYDMREFVRDFR